MKLPFAVVSAVLLAACAATGTQMQAECEVKYREFPDIYQCTYDAVTSRNPDILQDPRAKLYLLRGEQLALAVVRQQMSSLDAKVEWQKLYVELKAAKDQEIAASMLAISKSLQASQAAQPTSSAVVDTHRLVNPAVNCTSTKIGATLYTNCR